MLQVAITGARQSALVSVPDPTPREDWVVVKNIVAPMCTEYKAWLVGHATEFLGHEAVGEVAAVAQPCGLKIGDRVVVHPQYACGRCARCIAGDHIHCCHGADVRSFTGSPYGSATYAQYVIKPAWLCSPVPDEVSLERAGLALCALGPSCGAFESMGVTAFDTVVVTGLGPVGLGGIVNARYRGARVIGVESNAWRAQRAVELGAEIVLDPTDEATPARLLELTGGVGPDAGLDCSGSPGAHRMLVDALRRKGRLAFVGESGGDTVLHVSPDLLRKGLTLIGSWHYNLSLYPKVLAVLRSPFADGLTSHVFGMSDVQAAFETIAGQETAKVLLRPWE